MAGCILELFSQLLTARSTQTHRRHSVAHPIVKVPITEDLKNLGDLKSHILDVDARVISHGFDVILPPL